MRYVEDDVMAREQIESTKYIQLEKAIEILKKSTATKDAIKEMRKNAKQKRELS